MRFEELYLEILAEQAPPDQNQIGDPNGPEGEPDQPDVPDQPEQPDRPQQQRQPTAPKVKRVSEFEKVKMKWKEENPALTDDNMEDSIQFFNRRKNGLRIYNEPGTVENYVNLPEVTALLVRFPNMKPILTDITKLRDIQNYTWEEMEFFMDRMGAAAAEAPMMNATLDKTSAESEEASAYAIWDTKFNRVVDEGGLRAFKICANDESIAFGRIQHILRNIYGGNYWCITNTGPDEPTNMYSTYRSYSSYYFIMDKTKADDDRYFLSAINSIDMQSTSRSQGPYYLTPRPNGTEQGKSWNDIVKIYPQLRDKEHLFKYFGPTNKEKVDIKIDRINFREGDPNFFGYQHRDIQKQYINAGRLINNKVAFSVLPYDKNDATSNFRKDYIARTTINDYRNRFKCDDTADPFGILNMIQKETPQLYKYLDEFVLKGQLKLSRGVAGIKSNIIGINYNSVYTDIKTGGQLFQEKHGTHYGVMDVINIIWIKPMDYIQSKVHLLIKTGENGEQKVYLLQRYTSHNDYFYFLLNQAHYLNKNSNFYAKGMYFNKEEGDALMSSGEYRVLGYERKK